MSSTEDEADLLAAEYVLGTLDPATASRVRQRAETEPALRAAITAWEERLHPLAALAPPTPPPDAVWRRLAVSITPEPAPSPLLRTWRSVTLWRWTTAAGLALAAALGAFIVLRPAPATPVAALVPYGSAAPAYMAQLQPDGTLRVRALRPVQVAADKALELWALPPGASHPIPLGIIPAGGRGVSPPPLPHNGTQLMISLEPPGGSPSGLPSGPVLYAGTLHQT
jgi:anti-sigma-K factor RskA